MKSFILSFFLALTSTLFSQDFQGDIKLTKDSDTTFWYSYHLKDVEKLNLISPKSDASFLRINAQDYILELSKNSNKLYLYISGTYGDSLPSEIFVKKYRLSQKQVRQIKNLYDTLKIQEIPTDKLIKNWEQGLDGITYFFELKEGNSYSFKNYWTPSAQDEFEESKKILQFINELENILDYPAKRRKFENKIPFFQWSYNYGGVNVSTIPNTKKYYKKLKKYKRKHKK